MRRIIKVWVATLIMAAMMAASALPTLAQGPPTAPPGAFLLAAVVADPYNPAIDVNEEEERVTLETPNPVGPGHHSGFPDDSECQP